MNKWDVVLLRYPFTDLVATKIRPALVISPNSSSAGEDFMVIAITSNIFGSGAFDIVIQMDDPEFDATGLHFPSKIKIDKIFTLKKTLASRVLGKLGPALRVKVENQLRNFFELAPYQPPLTRS